MDAMKRRLKQPTTWLEQLGLTTSMTSNGVIDASTASLVTNAIGLVTEDI